MGKVNWSGKPEEFEELRQKVMHALSGVEPAGKPRSDHEPKALMLSSTARGSKSLPSYYLVYFLLVDLLDFPRMGAWEKSAWTVPIRYQDRLYGIEHQKMGLKICAPNEDPTARMTGRPTELQNDDSDQIAQRIRKAVVIAAPYFDWRAEQEAKSDKLNVLNHSKWLFERYRYFREQYFEQRREIETRNMGLRQDNNPFDLAAARRALNSGVLELSSESDWVAQAAVDAFFSWSEHAFIHVAILRGRIADGAQVSDLAAANWKDKFQAAIGLTDPRFKSHYDKLLLLRTQMRNFMAHGAFGKRGEAFLFHSGAGAVPVLLSDGGPNRYSLSGAPAFNESEAIDNIDSFLETFWASGLSAAKPHLFSTVPTILSFVADGTYANAMHSVELMSELVEVVENQMERAANMDW